MQGSRGLSEEPKVAVRLSRWAVLAQRFLYVCPLAMTFSILQLGWRSVYWKDLDDSSSTQSSVLTVIQFVAKFHEICIVASLSNLVLYQIQSELVDGEGVPFGLISSVYQVSSITYLWSWQFWGGLLESDLRKNYSRRLMPFALVIIASYQAAIAGPSLAITLLPRLDWWPVFTPVVEGSLNYIEKDEIDLWPARLSSDHLSNPECLTQQGYDSKYCPSAYRSAFAAWNGNAFLGDPNVTMPVTDSGMVRYLAASADSTSHNIRGHTKTSTISDISAKTLGCMWTQVTEGLDALRKGAMIPMNRPVITESMSSGQSLMKPFVSTHCGSFDIGADPKRFPYDPLIKIPNEDSVRNSWKVPESSWNTTVDFSNGTKLSWVRLSREPYSPSIAAVVVATLPAPNRPHPPEMSETPHRRVIPCTINAWWIPIELWIDPRSDSSIHDSLPDIIRSSSPLGQKRILSEAQKIYIEESWADSLSVV